jgi:hypothetical protein
MILLIKDLKFKREKKKLAFRLIKLFIIIKYIIL